MTHPAESVPRTASETGAFHVVTTHAARVIFALPFGIFGVFHLLHAQAMAPAVPLPGGAFWVYLTGVALIAGSLGMMTGILGRAAALGLAALMLVFILAVHLPGLGNPKLAQMSMIGLLKDTSLLGGALAFAGMAGRRA